MRTKRAVIRVEFDLDIFPGWNYSPSDMQILIEKLLKESIPHYSPAVEVMGVLGEDLPVD